MSSAKQSLFKELDLDEPQWDVFSMTYDALKARLAEAEAERATMISVVASARERADNAERECARLKAAWDAAYEQAMQNGAAANETKARLAEAIAWAKEQGHARWCAVHRPALYSERPCDCGLARIEGLTISAPAAPAESVAAD